MSNRIPNQLTTGDVIRSTKGTEQYRVTKFSDLYRNGLVIIVELEHVRTGKKIERTMTQVVKNWRMVKQA
jgi:hypothetical protein